MGYDGLGGDDVMRVIADVRRAYDVDPDRISLTGLSMGGGGTWQIGLRHPELFAALAPVCAVADYRRMVQAADAPLYDLDALDRQSPVALAGNAARMQVFIFHGAKDTTVPVADSHKMVERFRELGWLGKNVRYTEYPDVAHSAWIPAYKDAALLRTLAGDQARSGGAQGAGAAAARVHGDSGPVRQERARGRGRTSTCTARMARRTRSRPAARSRTPLADWGPMVGARFAVKGDADVTADDRARFSLVLVGAAPLNALAEPMAAPTRRRSAIAPSARSGPRATARSRAAARCSWAR